MAAGIEHLRDAVARFRGAQAAGYGALIAGEPELGPQHERDRIAPCSSECSAAYARARENMRPEEHAALGAHLLRAHAERAYTSTRGIWATTSGRPTRVGERLAPCFQWWSDGSFLALPEARDALQRTFESQCAELVSPVREGRERSGSAVGRAQETLACGRHPDAGPAGAAIQSASDYLRYSADVYGAGLEVAATALGAPLRHVVDLWTALRADCSGSLLRPEGRSLRVGEAWAAWGLREQLSRQVRVIGTHPVLSPAAHLMVWPAGRRVRIAPSGLEGGLWSELYLLEASGRALSLCLTSPGLPLELRHPAVASVARLWGSLAMAALICPDAWRRRYGASRLHARKLAQSTATILLCTGRWAAASVAVRAESDEAALASRALGVTVQPAVASVCLSRLSPGAPARVAGFVPAVAARLRERFDDDWYRNPRVAELMRGAAGPGGALSVEAFAEELGVQSGTGLSVLAELF